MRWTAERGRAAVRERAEGMCEAGCGSRGASFSHRVRAGQGGGWEPWNGAWTCGDGTRGCHGLLTAHPLLAKAGGWEVTAYGTPEDEPVWLATPEGARWWLLRPGPGPYEHLRVPADPADYGHTFNRPYIPVEFPMLSCRVCYPDTTTESQAERWLGEPAVCSCLRRCGSKPCTGGAWLPGTQPPPRRPLYVAPPEPEPEPVTEVPAPRESIEAMQERLRALVAAEDAEGQP